ncbi:hypothetical protein A5740_06700 [Mycobacterium sp. GA-1841]|nr:hypothetical protein A5740_06700 [Mycobacterium sp. GA-1841]
MGGVEQDAAVAGSVLRCPGLMGSDHDDFVWVGDLAGGAGRVLQLGRGVSDCGPEDFAAFLVGN